MPRSRLAAILAALLVPAVLATAPAGAGVGGRSHYALPAPAASKGADIARLFKQVTRSTSWRLVDEVRLQARTFHTQGIVQIGDKWVLSTVEITEPTVRYPGGQIIDGTDRTPGAGFAHIMSFDAAGRLLRDDVLSKPGALEYHPGGLDYDGRHLWVTVAQYRPNSTSTFWRIDPRQRSATAVLRAQDHFGGVVNDTARRRLVTLNWGSRMAYSWRIRRRPQLHGFANPLSVVRNPSHFVDYQDCKYLGRVPDEANPLMFCGGITNFSGFQLGGMALVDTATMRPVWEVPITIQTPAGNVLTRNPIAVDVVEGKLRVYVAPDDDATTVYAYEPQPQP